MVETGVPSEKESPEGRRGAGVVFISVSFFRSSERLLPLYLGWDCCWSHPEVCCLGVKREKPARDVDRDPQKAAMADLYLMETTKGLTAAHT